MTGPKIEGEYRRRANLTSSEIEQMRKMEAEGKSRKQIAAEFNCTPGSVTRRLGAVRCYKGLRVKIEEPQPA